MNNIVLVGEKIVEIQVNKKSKKDDVEEDGDDMLDHYLKQAKDNMDNDEDELLDDEDGIGDFDDLIYAEDFETEIDRQNSLLYLKNSLKKLSFENNNYYMQLIGCLSNEKQKSLEKILIG